MVCVGRAAKRNRKSSPSFTSIYDFRWFADPIENYRRVIVIWEMIRGKMWYFMYQYHGVD